MIGSKIKSIIENSDMSFVQISEKLGISYQYLFKIFGKDSVETRYLFQIAAILNIPVTLFFEDEPGGKNPVVDIEKLQSENLRLISRIEELTEQLNDKKLIIEYINKNNLLDGNAIENIGSTPKSKFRANGNLSLNYLIDLMEKEKNIDGSLSASKFNLVIKKMKDENSKNEGKI